ncbi:hypothetical protein ACFYKX_19860 [Cytobacillus sp. FJAT-54145]|uniref:Uncharacterized protein n=1 Tax=Cytobacillus spartinae TaxID=3299023 RepID=A0ABW6KF23_9BACI
MLIKILAFLIIVGIFSLKEFKNLKKQNMKKEMVIYILFLLFSCSFFVLNLSEVKVASPLEGIRFLFEPIGKSIEGIFMKEG